MDGFRSFPLFGFLLLLTSLHYLVNKQVLKLPFRFIRLISVSLNAFVFTVRNICRLKRNTSNQSETMNTAAVRAIITGGGQGLGFAAASRLVKAGAKVVI